ncbi:MAG TPA: secretin N-terminal domain-containing protein [Thermoanaerobaculia bacterium]|nr:secretin N-terminal domain-containing protein [Thermoanaerobaculia bacterium]
MKRFLTIALTLLLAAASAFADDAADAGKSLTVRTFQFKFKKAENAAAAIKPLMSAEGSMSIRPSGNSLVVTDQPENLKKIAAALADFDVEAQAFRLSVRLVAATRAGGNEGRVPAELKDVASKLALLRYNALDNIGSAEVLGKEGEPGEIDLTGYRADFKFGEYDASSDSINLTDFKLSRLEGDVLSPMMKTTLNLKLGQTVIISAQKQAQSNRALMIVFTAKR